MAKRSFTVKAVWDAENAVWVSESDIIGLHVEAASLAEFQDLVAEFAADLIVSNHFSAEDIAGTDLRDLIPAVVIQQGGTSHAAE
jgi:hypothetical protein